MVVNWSAYDNRRFRRICDRYLPNVGEGNNMAQQAVTAACKLIYKWYNDGDVYDNQHGLEGWLNDLSSFANWLRKLNEYVADILDKIYEVRTEGEYEDLLYELADYIFEEEYLEQLEEAPATGSIYECDGPYVFEESSNDDEEDEEY